jgi:cell division protein FtsB
MPSDAPATAPKTRSAASGRARKRARSGAEVRQHRRRVLTYSLFGLALVLMVNALVGDNGYLAGMRARREYDKALAGLDRLQTENAQLKERARRLKEDPSAIEEAARKDLGLIRPGETLVIVHDKPEGAPR